MKTVLPALIACLVLGAPVLAVPAADASRDHAANLIPEFDHFQVILDRMPFGRPPPATAPVALEPAAQAQALAEQALAKQIRLCAVTRTQQGIAAGLIDSSSNPPKNYYLYVGDEIEGVKLLAANLEDETAEIEKNGARLTFTMTGVKSSTSPAALAAAGRSSPTRSAPVPAPTPTPFASAPPFSDQPLRPGIIRRPSHEGRPPMPGVSPMQFAEMQKTREELAKIKEAGGDVPSYMARLRERKAQEKAEKAAAEQAAREAIEDLARKATQEELAKREREINLSLIEQGARPVSDIVLTPEEEKALVEKGILP